MRGQLANVEGPGSRARFVARSVNPGGESMLRRNTVNVLALSAFVLMLGLTGAPRAAVVWDEAVNGPFGDFDHQTQLGAFKLGDNEIRGVTGQTSPGVFDRDYFT